MNIDTARMIAARVWCDQDMANIEIDETSAERIAVILSQLGEPCEKGEPECVGHCDYGAGGKCSVGVECPNYPEPEVCEWKCNIKRGDYIGEYQYKIECKQFQTEILREKTGQMEWKFCHYCGKPIEVVDG